MVGGKPEVRSILESSENKQNYVSHYLGTHMYL